MGVSDPAVYDHYRTTGSAEAGELFRVVGVDDERVTLLRLTEDGERVATGDLRQVDRAEFEAAFEPGENPDPKYGAFDYLAALFAVGGVAVAAASPDDRLSGVVLAGAGLYLLWRRHG